MTQKFEIALSFATENQELVEKVYHYLKAEGISVFFAPSEEGQMILSGKNQREIFYEIFGLRTEYVALFVSKFYVTKTIPMEEAEIAFAKHGNDAKVIPVYLDESSLPEQLFDANTTNFFKSANPAVIANHLAAKIKTSRKASDKKEKIPSKSNQNVMNVSGNKANTQIFVQN